ncbi:hypothetical protein BG015_003979 [Linnemannia schmuckeri]|uniref:Uncharacterized protein n=1 Tax=Linnemannia schmuckeri TaxID=64567 RepID=A0A9P5S4C3_9FUNG|nr:hypothetical protein BG015_003979 [Linnemannia schmuckeri]
MLNKKTLKAILGGALLLASAIAQDTSAAVHPNVAISAEFPKAAAGVIPNLVSGRANNLKVTLHNSGAHDLTVKMIVGSVAEVKDFTTVTHNAHSALVLPYTIKVTHPSRDAGLTLLAELVDPTSVLHHQFPALIFNSTVHFTQPASSWFDWKLILGSMLMAGAITAIVMTAMTAKSKPNFKKQHEKLMKDKNAPKMAPKDRYAVLANMRADDTPLNVNKTKDDQTTTNAPKMSAMDRYAVLSEMKAKDDKPLPEPKTKPITTTATTDVLTGGEPYGILSQMKALEGDGNGEKKDRNTEPELKYHKAPQMAGASEDRFEVLADMKATRGDDVLNPDKTMDSTRAL